MFYRFHEKVSVKIEHVSHIPGEPSDDGSVVVRLGYQMSDGKFVLRLNKDLWNKQLEAPCRLQNEDSNRHFLIRKRGIAAITPDGYSPRCKHSSLKTCKLCRDTSQVDSELNDSKLLLQRVQRRVPIEEWMFTEKVLTHIQRVIDEIPQEVQDAQVPCLKEESNLTALGVLTYSKLIKHIVDLRVESVQRLMRPIIQKLLQHPRNVNIFNQPVDFIGLRLSDYPLRISKPMDLGTVKSQLLLGEYSNVESCAADISLVFSNAISYNPPSHVIHQIAQAMKDDFEIEMRTIRDRCSKEVDRKSSHECTLCQGSCCPICGEKCLKFEPPVIVCHGTCGQRIKRNTVFYLAPDGSRSWCQKCQTGLPVIVSEEKDTDDNTVVTLLKKDLLKRKFDEEVAEPWAQCDTCGRWVHQICALFNDRYNASDSGVDAIKFCCPLCRLDEGLKPWSSRLQEICQQINDESTSGSSSGSSSDDIQTHTQTRLTEYQLIKKEVTMSMSDSPGGATGTGTFISPGTPNDKQQQRISLGRKRSRSEGTAVRTGNINGNGNVTAMLKTTQSQLQCREESPSPLPLPSPRLLHHHRLFPCPVSIPIPIEQLRDRDYDSNSTTINTVKVFTSERSLSLSSSSSLAVLMKSDVSRGGIETTGSTGVGPGLGLGLVVKEEYSESKQRQIKNSSSHTNNKNNSNNNNNQWFAESLPRTRLSDFLETVVRDRVTAIGFPEAADTITIRVTSCSDHYIEVPDVIHSNLVTTEGQRVPKYMPYRQKCIMLFQRIEGVDVCLFSLYVQEFDEHCPQPNQSRVYIAYLDSVEFFRPREARTAVYHELMVGYFKWAQMRGFRQGHLWACPPQRGDSFIFWCHPMHQRTPTRERLSAWYASMLHRASRMGVLDTVGTMWSEFFSQYIRRDDSLQRAAAKCSLVGLGLLGKPASVAASSSSLSSVSSSNNNNGSFAATLPSDQIPVCPPVFEGDFWVNECLRVHRVVKSRAKCTDGEDKAANQRQARDMLKNLMSRPYAYPFLQPVNPIVLNIPTYFDIIKNPMDLGTVRNNLRANKYFTMLDMTEDIRLVFSNAMLFNPVGHVVHTMAKDLLSEYETKLLELVLGRNDFDKDIIDMDTVNRSLSNYPLGNAVETPRAGDASNNNSSSSTRRVDDGTTSSAASTGTGSSTTSNVSFASNDVQQRLHEAGLRRHVSFGADQAAEITSAATMMMPSSSRMPRRFSFADSDAGQSVNGDDDTHNNNNSNSDMLSSCQSGDEFQSNDMETDHCSSSEGDRTPRRIVRMESTDSVFGNGSSWSGEDWAQRPLTSQMGRGSGSDCPTDPLAGQMLEKPQLGMKGVIALMNELSKNVNRLKDDLFVMSFAPPVVNPGNSNEDNVVDDTDNETKRLRRVVVEQDSSTSQGPRTGGGKGKGKVAALMRKCVDEPKEDFTETAWALLKDIVPDTSDPDTLIISPFVDCRHTFLEMCQYRHYQFDSLRRAKHSTLLLLYHLHNSSSEHLRPHCFECKGVIQELRWHCDQCSSNWDVCSTCVESGFQHSHPLIPKRVTFI
eukprot:gene3895-7772_t